MSEERPDPGIPPAGLPHHPPPQPGPRPSRVAVLAATLVALAVAALWAAFSGVGPARFDNAALAESIEERTPGTTTVAVLITTLGSTAAMALLAVAVGAWCWARGTARRRGAGRRRDGGGEPRVHRAQEHPRPEPSAGGRPAGGSVTNESLPSGHATMSFVVTGTIVVLAWAGRSALARVALVVAAAVWIGAVGATRVYLGVHWFSDVLAGWAVGAAWLALCVTVWLRWRARVPA